MKEKALVLGAGGFIGNHKNWGFYNFDILERDSNYFIS